MVHTVTLLPGDYVGPEVSDAVRRIISAAGVRVDWDVQVCGSQTWESEQALIPPRVFDSIRRNKVVLKHPMITPAAPGVPDATTQLRRSLGLYCNIRAMINLWGIPCRQPALDIVIIREATEDVYAGIEHEVIPGVVETLKVTTEKASERIARAAFSYARANGRKKVTTVHKANIMKLADGLFLEVSRQVARDFPEIIHQDIIVDNCAMQLVSRPWQFDVLLLGNLFGDIISDLCAGLLGGIAMVPSVSLNDEGIALFEAPHGHATELVGKDLANPLPLLHSAIHMLRHLGEQSAAARIVAAVRQVLSQDIKTKDMGGSVTESVFTAAIVAQLKANDTP